MQRYLLTFIFMLFFSLPVFSEKITTIPRTKDPPAIDGVIDEEAWRSALKFSGFKTYQPDFDKDPSYKTEAYMTYDSENIYFALRCFDSESEKIKAAVSKRDAIFQDDYVGIVLDTFNDMQSGFGFLMNPFGIQGDGIMDINGNLIESHDMVWYSKGQIDEKGFSVECRIPLKSIRFPSSKTVTMRVIFFRSLTRLSEQSSFPPLSPEGGFLIQAQAVQVSDLKYKRVIEVLPAVTHSSRFAHSEGELKSEESETEVSLTGKIGLTSDLTLDAAYNPDFSQVESDAGQIDINLRYDLFFSEKRPFFLEGNELFDFAGNVENAPLIAVVHTRRIISPFFGLKLTGKIGQKNTLAALFARDNLQNDEVDKHPDFAIFRNKYALKEDSYVGGFYAGKEYGNGFNRVIGMDGRFRLSKTSLASFHLFGAYTRDQKSEGTNKDHALALNYSYNTRKWMVDLGYQDISQDFQVDTGFLMRTGIRRLTAVAMYQIRPKSKFFQRIEPLYWSFHLYDTFDELFETFNLVALRFHLPRSTMIRFNAFFGNEVYAGERFNVRGGDFEARSQITKQLFLYVFIRQMESIYYDPDDPYQGYGNRSLVSIDYQPLEKLSFSLSATYNDFFRKSDKTKIYDYAILRSRNTYQVNKYLFLRAIFEYNFYYDRLTTDALISFTYIPGTVLHVGYGSAFQKLQWDGRDYVRNDRFLETNRGFFFKVSYLWRF